MNSFLLRFQEKTINAGLSAEGISHGSIDCPYAGTQTVTRIQGEATDPHGQGVSFCALPSGATDGYEEPTPDFATAVVAGTQTLTEVRREAADRDPAPLAFSVVPTN